MGQTGRVCDRIGDAVKDIAGKRHLPGAAMVKIGKGRVDSLDTVDTAVEGPENIARDRKAVQIVTRTIGFDDQKVKVFSNVDTDKVIAGHGQAAE